MCAAEDAVQLLVVLLLMTLSEIVTPAATC